MYSLLSVIALTIGVLVVSSSNTVYALMYLIGLFITIAGLLVCQGITYIGLLYIVVYVGAIAILFLFVVIIINVRDVELNTTGSRYTQSLPLTMILGSLFLYLVTYFSGDLNIASISFLSTLSNIDTNPFKEGTFDATYDSYSIVQSLGIVLYSWGSMWLVLAAIILLLCIVGPIAITYSTGSSFGSRDKVTN